MVTRDSGELRLPMDKIREICQRFGVRELSLFGSSLRDDFRPDSDVDLLVEFQPDAHIGFIELGEMEQELEAVLGRRVDLGSKRSLKPSLREEILASARVLYAA